ncbi:MAG TPA: chemotaxis protein CheW [Polyangiaceae bacterium]|nr:chemotaxis protein CheW [Polyangiaceae bacterium]
MSEPQPLAEFVAAYVNEVDEHLSSANKHLLVIDAALRKGETNLRSVRETFRALHTVKGLSAMVGVEPVVTLAHRMEALLRTADQSASKLPMQAVDALLQGVRMIEGRVRAFGAGEPVSEPSPELLALLDGLDAEHGTVVPSSQLALDLPPAMLAKLLPLEIQQFEQGLCAGQRALRVDFTPSAHKSANGTNINSVRERVSRLGEIVKVVPLSAAVGPAAPSGLTFAILLLTTADDASVAQAADTDVGQVQLLCEPRQPVPSLAPPTTSESSLAEERMEGTEPRQRSFVRVDVTRLDEAVERLSALIVTRYRLSREVSALTEAGVDTRNLVQIMNENARQLRDLRGSILRVRMVPVSELLERVPLLVRGLRRAAQRLVRVEMDAGGAELDKSVAEHLFPALVHLVRNAVDHAIETPDERARRGKPEEGLLRIRCSARSNMRLELSISDDGRGIDPEAVARKAGVATPQSPAALLDLLCRPGLSTREVATLTSGRGMGMEIVKRICVDQLGGDLSLRTELGLGSTFTLQVPISISIVNTFAFQCADQRFVVPVAMVEEILEVDWRKVTQTPDPRNAVVRAGMLERRGEVVPLFSLAELFRLPGPAAASAKALLVRRSGEALAFGVDRMLGQQEVVVRPLEDQLVMAPGIAGATDLGDGRPTLVLDLVALSASLSSRERSLHIA